MTQTLDQCFETGEVGNQGLRYNIQVRQTGPFTYEQRHIWINDGRGNAYIDPWIASLKCIYEDIRRRGNIVL